jgi:hypothetical protein
MNEFSKDYIEKWLYRANEEPEYYIEVSTKVKKTVERFISF